MFIRSGATVDREHPSILTDSQGNGVVTFAIEAVNSAPTATLTSTQNAQACDLLATTYTAILLLPHSLIWL